MTVLCYQRQGSCSS